ncbi:MAG TPA: single-stranded-DNA-specific exonuclease RecJ [Thermoanaerobaculia bacterium]|jgi:single-stranded-DNA-specific exonuclease
MEQETAWRLSAADSGDASRLAREAGVSATLAGLLLRRGVATRDEARAFLAPGVDGLHDPARLLGAEAAADLLVSAARRGRRIVVFGDYDVDGVTAVAQLRAALARVGADAAAFIPHRLRDGYGLKPETVRRVLAELSPAVIVTVDCGITAIEGVAAAREAGVDVIVTDHHLVPDALPAGAVVVNPRQPGCAYPEKELAACGIALKIAEAIARRAGVSLSRESLLRAACLGTIADLVPLTGENRVIAAAGLAALAGARAPGLRALLEEAGLPPGIAPTAEEVAFRIAPRLNAAGRLDSARLALSVFEERDPQRARLAARELSLRNAERQSLERRVVAEARERIERDEAPEGASLVVEADPGWHRGVLGIAASRLAREYRRPVLLFGVEGERVSGSGRSIAGVALHELMSRLRHHFTEFGGHSQAVGATLPAERFAAFREEARALFRSEVPAEALAPCEEAEAELEIESVDASLLRELALLEPHGAGNPRPVFLARGARASGPWTAVGERGLRGRLRLAGDGGHVRGIAWAATSELARLASGTAPFEIHYRLAAQRDWGLQAEVLAARARSLCA